METEEFIDTRNTDKVINMSMSAIKNNDWLVIVGEVGAGKSMLCQNIASTIRAKTNKFKLVDFGAIRETCSTSISSIETALLEVLSENERVSRNPVMKYNFIKERIHKIVKDQKLVLIFDEAQNLTPAVMRDLKKLHEINGVGNSKMFSILMFAKNDFRFEKFLGREEVGWRLIKTQLYNLDGDEVLRIATAKFGIRFESGKNGATAKQVFMSNVFAQTPLGVKRTVDLLKSMYGKAFDGLVTVDNLRKVFLLNRKDILQRWRITQTEVRRRFKDVTGKDLDKAVLSNFLAGRETKASEQTVSTIKSVVVDLIQEVGGPSDSNLFFNEAVNA